MRMTVESLMNLEHLPLHPENTLIKFDGKYMVHVVAADDVEGWVEVLDITQPLDASGNVARKVLYGTVEFVNAEEVQ